MKVDIFKNITGLKGYNHLVTIDPAPDQLPNENDTISLIKNNVVVSGTVVKREFAFDIINPNNNSIIIYIDRIIPIIDTKD